jgi:hypothetical protein
VRRIPETYDRLDWPRLVAQTVNDIIGILTPTYGKMYMQANATVTDIVTAATPVKIAGTTTAGDLNQRFTHSDNRLTYIGSRTKVFEVSVVGVLVNGGNNDQYGVYVYKNGSVVPESEKFITADSGGRVTSFSTQCLLELSTDDYVEIWLENLADTDDATVSYLSVIVTPAT